MHGVSPYDGLEPQVWRGLLARGAIFHAARTRLSALCDMLNDEGAVRLALLDLEMRVAECSAQDYDDDTTVTRVVEAWDATLTQTLTLTQLDEAARTLLSELQELAHRARGEDPFQQIFCGISAKARDLYGAAWRDAHLAVAHVRSHPRGVAVTVDPYVVTARTPFCPDNVQDVAVELQVFCDAFGPAAYAALPILLIHECVAHVPARQDRAKNDSLFAEGFLDWVAYFFLDQWAGTIDVELAAAARQHARELRALLTSRTDREGRARRIGHRAAETLVDWFQCTYDMEPYAAQLRVAILGVRLNQLPRPLYLKDCFVSHLNWPVPTELDDALRAWHERHIDLGILVDQARCQGTSGG